MRYRVVAFEVLDSLIVTVTEYQAPEYVEVLDKWHFTIRVEDCHVDRVGEVISYLAMLFAESTP